jgi:hypothetical protein
MQQSARLTKSLIIGGKAVLNIVSDSVQLDLFSTGRATFVVICEDEPKGVVELQLGYKADELTPYFLGAIESKHFANGQWFITCRELIGALTFKTPMAIRFACAADVLTALESTGFKFVHSNKKYMQRKVPCFYHNGDGISALRQLGKVFNIPDYIFQQRPDGLIYVGSWHDSPWANTPIDNLAEHIINTKNASMGEMMAVPQMRPGIKLNNRFIIETTLLGNKQKITWSKTLYAA